MTKPKITYRTETDDDEPFMRRVYDSSRDYELDVVEWDPEERKKFLDFQYIAQKKSYRQQFPKADFLVILKDGQPIGRVYVDNTIDPILLIDIIVLPEERNQGIGGEIIGGILAQAGLEQKEVSICVEQNNPAFRLYDRLGFVVTEENEMHHRMLFTPPGYRSKEKEGA